jgi:hypothetical protein
MDVVGAIHLHPQGVGHIQVLSLEGGICEGRRQGTWKLLAHLTHEGSFSGIRFRSIEVVQLHLFLKSGHEGVKESFRGFGLISVNDQLEHQFVVRGEWLCVLCLFRHGCFNLISSPVFGSAAQGPLGSLVLLSPAAASAWESAFWMLRLTLALAVSVRDTGWLGPVLIAPSVTMLFKQTNFTTCQAKIPDPANAGPSTPAGENSCLKVKGLKTCFGLFNESLTQTPEKRRKPQPVLGMPVWQKGEADQCNWSALDNGRTRKAVNNLEALAEVCFFDDAEKELWTVCNGHHHNSMELCRMGWFHRRWHSRTPRAEEAEFFFQKWINLNGRAGITNCIHPLAMGHIAQCMFHWRNMHQHSQQSWEAFNGLLKTFCFRRTGGWRCCKPGQRAKVEIESCCEMDSEKNDLAGCATSRVMWCWNIAKMGLLWKKCILMMMVWHLTTILTMMTSMVAAMASSMVVMSHWKGRDGFRMEWTPGHTADTRSSTAVCPWATEQCLNGLCPHPLRMLGCQRQTN